MILIVMVLNVSRKLQIILEVMECIKVISNWYYWYRQLFFYYSVRFSRFVSDYLPAVG